MRTYVWCHDETELVFLLLIAKVLCIICRHQSLLARLDPDLNEVHGICLRVVELGVRDASTRASHLNVASLDELHITHTIFVRQSTVNHIGKYFEVFMRMSAKPSNR